MCFFKQGNARTHMAAATQRDLHGVHQLPWPARSADLSPIEHVWDMVKRELTLSLSLSLSLSPEPATTIAELQQRVKNAWDYLSLDDIRHLYDRLRTRMHVCVAARGGTLCCDVTVWAPLTATSVLHLV